MQERLNAVQEELKQEVAAAELARSHAMTVLRKQQTLKEVCSQARPGACTCERRGTALTPLACPTLACSMRQQAIGMKTPHNL